MKYASFVFLVICFIFISVTNIQAFRCGSDLVGRWDTREQVYKRCGAPFKYGSTKVNDNGVIKNGETWYYNCGYGDFIYAVIFINNIVFREDHVIRGTGKGQCK
jgi:hypothetical protein